MTLVAKRCASGERPIETAPKNGATVLVRCGGGPDCYHLVNYVDGAWMEQSGAYILPEKGEVAPTHWSPVPIVLERAKFAVLACPLLTAAAYLMLLGLGLACGLVIENLFDLLP